MHANVAKGSYTPFPGPAEPLLASATRVGSRVMWTLLFERGAKHMRAGHEHALALYGTGAGTVYQAVEISRSSLHHGSNHTFCLFLLLQAQEQQQQGRQVDDGDGSKPTPASGQQEGLPSDKGIITNIWKAPYLAKKQQGVAAWGWVLLPC